jgi:hypothetical protein
VGKPEGKRPPERPKLRFEDIIVINFKEQGKKSWNVGETQGKDTWQAVEKDGDNYSDFVKCGEFVDWLRND